LKKKEGGIFFGSPPKIGGHPISRRAPKGPGIKGYLPTPPGEKIKRGGKTFLKKNKG